MRSVIRSVCVWIRGGDWDGWISVGKEGRFDEGVGCGPGWKGVLEVERAF